MYSQRNLFIATALLEIGSGLVTLFLPSVAIWLLFGVNTTSPELLATGRLYGAALLAIGVACWCIRDEKASRSLRAVLCGMLTYNVGACSVLPLVAMLEGISGALLWPATLLHAALTVWCVSVIREIKRASRSVETS